MRYIFVSDIHGNYDKLQTALAKVRFDKNKDTLVSLGDAFDRGNQNLEVLKFLMDCPNRILVMGNHDLRLKEVLLGKDALNKYDKQNGALHTIRNFCQNINVYGAGSLLMLFKYEQAFSATRRLLWQYFDECCYAVEWSNLIGVHAWVPTVTEIAGGIEKNVCPTFWREARHDNWHDAVWSNVANMMKDKAYPEKPMIIGHWYAFRIRQEVAGQPIDYDHITDFGVYQTDKLIAIDGATCFPDGQVNVYVYETDEKPTFIY